MRPFQLFVEEKDFFPKDNNKSCLHGRTSVKMNLDYASDFINKYKTSGFFGLMFLADFTHSNSYSLNQIDDDFHDFLLKFYKNKVISSTTILILFSDHGPRFADKRSSMKGLLEERNPFYSIYLPSLFKKRYPEQFKTFNQNTNKLVTPLDIHNTLIDLISLEKHGKISRKDDRSLISSRSKSLISDNIALARSCSQAGIDDHWCACLKRTRISSVSSRLSKMVDHFLSFLNGVILKDHLDLCSKLELSKVNHVYQLDSVIPKVVEQKPFSLIEWIRSLITNHFYLVEPKLEKDFRKYLFQIVTKPNNGTYEFTIVDETSLIVENILNQEADKFEIDKKDISRINKYGNQPKCIEEKHSELRKYCFCKS
jgi:hypothetical protein